MQNDCHDITEILLKVALNTITLFSIFSYRSGIQRDRKGSGPLHKVTIDLQTLSFWFMMSALKLHLIHYQIGFKK